MNPAPNAPWPDLHYVDTEQVELDVCAIIARGTRLRRRRLVTKVAVAAVVVGIAPVAVVTAVGGSVPLVGGAHSSESGPAFAPRNAPLAGGPGFGVNQPTRKARASTRGSGADTTGRDLRLSLARAVVRDTTTLPNGYHRLLAIAGAQAGGGLWFTAAAPRLTLFGLTVAGALRSWPLPTLARGVRANAGLSMAVSAAGVAWIGVDATLLRLDTRNSRLRTWQLPGVAAGSITDSVAVSPDGHVAVAISHSSSVRVLDPRAGTFRQIALPGAADQALAVGYARNGVLGIGYRHPGKSNSGAVLLVKRTGAQRSVPVPQPTAVAAYGGSALLVGVSKPYVVLARGHSRPLIVPADSPPMASITTRPVPLAGNRLAVAMGNAILTFPTSTESDAIASTRSTLWVTAPPRCRPRHRCPAGYQFIASDSDGNLWVVPKADPHTIELFRLR